MCRIYLGHFGGFSGTLFALLITFIGVTTSDLITYFLGVLIRQGASPWLRKYILGDKEKIPTPSSAAGSAAASVEDTRQEIVSPVRTPLLSYNAGYSRTNTVSVILTPAGIESINEDAEDCPLTDKSPGLLTVSSYDAISQTDLGDTNWSRAPPPSQVRELVVQDKETGQNFEIPQDIQRALDRVRKLGKWVGCVQRVSVGFRGPLCLAAGLAGVPPLPFTVGVCLGALFTMAVQLTFGAFLIQRCGVENVYLTALAAVSVPNALGHFLAPMMAAAGVSWGIFKTRQKNRSSSSISDSNWCA